jgi:DNA-binding MarR family transcriptional regulator
MDALVQVSFRVVAVLSEVAAAHDLSLTQLRVLAILRDREPPISELAAHLGLERSSVSGLIDRAEQHGLLRRHRSADDQRVVHVRLSPAGRRLAAELTDVVAGRLAVLTEHLGASDRRDLAFLLAQLLD